MIVVDASAFVELLVQRADPALRAALVRSGHWVVPEHFRIEVANGLRGLWLGRKIDDTGFEAALAQAATQRLDVWPSVPLMPRMRELAANAYDAAYLALAEELGAPLVTIDAKYARVPGIRCRIIPDPQP